MMAPADQLRELGPRPAEADGLAPLYCTDGPLLCRVRIWTDSEWDALSDAARPARCQHFPGLGWVAAVPEVHLG